MLKVKGVSAAAPFDESFSMRVATRANTIGETNLKNTESISRYYPGQGGLLQAAAYTNVVLKVKDAGGNPVAGEQVDVTFRMYTKNSSYDRKVTYVSDFNGNLDVIYNLPGCDGTIETKNYTNGRVPTDHYKGTAQTASVILSLPNADFLKPTTLNYLHICTETYLGRS